MTERSGTDDTHTGEAEGRHSRRRFLSRIAPPSIAAAAAVGISVAVDQDAPERTRPAESTRLTVLPGGGLVYDVKAYGARGDGKTDDAAAVQSAIHAAAQNGGTVYFPVGTYAIGKTLVCDQNAKAFTLSGAGGGLQYTTTPSVLLYMGSAGGPSGGLLTFNSSFGFEVCHLAFNYNNKKFTGDLVNIDGAPHAADTQDFHIHHCTSSAVSGSSARSIVRLNKAIIGTISNCHWTGAANAVRLGDLVSEGGGYVNAVQVEKCTFNFNSAGHIFIGTPDGESLTIRDCTFEAGGNTRGIIGGQGNLLYNPVVESCWFGDASATVHWIDGLNSEYVGTVRDCRFGGNGGVPSTGARGIHLVLSGAWKVEGNSFEQGIVYSTNGGNTLNGGDTLNGGKTLNRALQITALANEYNLYQPKHVVFDPRVWPSMTAPYPPNYVSLGNTFPPLAPGDPRGPQDPRVRLATANRIVPALQS